ncbi:hypothetical protein MGYG_02282 [Nannizzia gypsea CBS 118893]|uniref:Uncharacterized protein n=1 Tax=Arthroderma gypseum (strain ATCC MYA-4604 / CBS 118893) TaxID=535722 RepID=E4UQU3_ARTGP|nr:hypothetical protein MGYG_02282 [Nannizzia gypsea CBS 118893]EFQ99269.1 hypothetical protein MGYG_02282 [Nannizzia gypsea CBS 118893]
MALLQGWLHLLLLQAGLSAAFPYPNTTLPLSDRDVSIGGNRYYSQTQARDPTCNHSDYDKIDCPAPSICYHQRGGVPACCPPDTNCDPPWVRDPSPPAQAPTPSQSESNSESNQANGSGNSGVGVSGSSRAENHNSNNFNVSVRNAGATISRSKHAGLLSIPLLTVAVLIML